MVFKMKGFSPFTKETRYEGPRGGSGDDKMAMSKEKRSLKRIEVKKKTNIQKDTENKIINSLKQKLYNMEDPNSEAGKKIQAILDKKGVEWRGPNPDEVD